MSGAVGGGVDLQWRPALQIAHVGDTVNLGLYIVSTSGGPWPISAMDVIVANSPTYLMYSSLVAVPNQWLADGLFPSSPDNINANVTDGLIMYSAWANLGQNANAVPDGLLATTFRFNARAAVTETSVTIPASVGVNTTAIYDGTVPNLVVTGALGLARVMIVAPAVPIVSSVAQVKALDDTKQVAVLGPVVTRRFATFFYIEDQSRAAGIRVNCSAGPNEGTVAAVQGTVTTIDGERVIDNAQVGTGVATAPLGPMMMTAAATRVGLKPEGLLVTLAGRVSTAPGTSQLMLNDGSPLPVQLELDGFDPPDENSFVCVTGALGTNLNGPILRVNNSNDLRVQ